MGINLRMSLVNAIARAREQKHLNALINFDETVTLERLRTRQSTLPSARIDPAFDGVPFVVKDNIAVAGFAQTGGCPAFANFYPKQSSSVIERLENAGAVVLAKANLHELAFGITSKNAYYGSVLNPLSSEYLAGGSSGGCAAAIASGMVPFAIGNDTGGSIRIPAALCGVFGFRPTTGRYATDGVMTLSPTRDAIGVMGNSIDWIRRIDNLLVGSTAQAFPQKIRLALPRQPFWVGLASDMQLECERTLKRLEKNGIEFVEINADRLLALDDEIGFVIAVYETWMQFKNFAPSKFGVSVEALIPQIASPDVRGLFEMMASPELPPEAAYLAAMVKRVELQHSYAELLSNSGANALMMPTTIRSAVRLDEADECELNGIRSPTFPTFVRQTSPASVAGCPSISIPAGGLPNGLAFGLMLESLPNSDSQLINIAEIVYNAL
jgi:indoleacetamide hydrolase